MDRQFLPKISVLMSCYNSEKYVENAIESILAQSYRNFEFIIIDDGSTDDTFKIITKYSLMDSRIRLIAQDNIGLTKSLNKGIDMATGEFVARMDADDISLPGRFSSFIKFINISPDVQFYSTPAYLLNESKHIETVIPNFFRRKFFNQEMLDFYCSLIHGTLIVKTDIIRRLRYNESFVCAQDYELYSRAISKGFKISYDSKNLSYKLRIHDTNISKVKSSTQVEAFKTVLALRQKKFYEPTLLNRIYFLLMDVYFFVKFKFEIK